MVEKVYTQDEVRNALESFTNWGASATDWVERNYGHEAAVKYLRCCGEQMFGAVAQAAAGDGSKVLDGIAVFHRMMAVKPGDVKVIEDDEKKQVQVMCGSGLRMRRQGKPFVKRRTPEGLPYYCVHCSVWWEEMPQEQGINMKFCYSEEGPCIYEFRKK